VHLSHLEFDLLWEQLNLGERPYPITVPSFGATMDDRDLLRKQVERSLIERGLHDGAELSPGLEDQLIMLVRNRFTIDGQLSAGEHLQVLAAGRGEYGLLAVQSDHDVRLEPVRAAALTGAVVALLPDEQPGPGTPVSVPSTVFDDAAEAYAVSGYVGFENAMRHGGISGRELRALATLVEGGRHGGGQLAANAVDHLGRRTRSPVLNWFDTDAGRYLVHTERRRDGLEWITVVPADSGRIVNRLEELVSHVRAVANR
jgi:hypothetical protein